MSGINKKAVTELIKENIRGINVWEDEPMSAHTSFKIGGPAAVFVSPKSEEEIIAVSSLLRGEGIDFIVTGNGSNLLVSDKGIDSVVINISKDFSHINCIDETIYASAGVLLSRIASLALENSLEGFEFASGIPGTLGGAIVMNAGAYGGEMKDVVLSTKYIDKTGKICTCTRAEHEFLYRKSRFRDGDIILSSSIRLKKGNDAEIRSVMNELAAKRREKQPLEFPSAGSTFKRPEGYFAAKLIDDAGLRGYRIGGAMVSDKHTGFVVNVGGASFDDVTRLMAHIQSVVYDKFKVELEPEVKIIGIR